MHHRKGGTGRKNNWFPAWPVMLAGLFIHFCVTFQLLYCIGFLFSYCRHIFSIRQGTWPFVALNSLPRNSATREERYNFCSFKLETSWSRTLHGSSVYCRPISVARQLGDISWLRLVHILKDTEACCPKRWNRFWTERYKDCCRNMRVIRVQNPVPLGIQLNCEMSSCYQLHSAKF